MYMEYIIKVKRTISVLLLNEAKKTYPCVQIILESWSYKNTVSENILFQFVQTVKPSFDDEDKEDGMKPENKSKNSNMNVIPGLLFHKLKFT